MEEGAGQSRDAGQSLQEPSLQSAFLGPANMTNGKERGAPLTGTHSVESAGAVACRSLAGGAEVLWDSLPAELRKEGLHAGSRNKVWSKQLRDGSERSARSMGEGRSTGKAGGAGWSGVRGESTGRERWEEEGRSLPVQAWAEAQKRSGLRG